MPRWVISTTLLAVLVCANFARAAAERPNVLFIMSDDLRVEVGCYGSPALTPNVDRLAKRGVRFEHAYCQQSLCNPSRSSMLTGLRPDTIGLWCNSIHFRDLKPEVVTLPQAFKSAGYTTRNVGKIFHNWHTAEHGDHRSWSAPEYLYYENHGNDKPVVSGQTPENLATTKGCQRCDVADDAYFDGRVADEAVRVLKEIKDDPFFLAVGFWKPHSPMNAPKRYWDRYERDALPKLDGRRPAGTPDIAFHQSTELKGTAPNQPDFTPEQAAEVRHGYLANIAYMDTQLGKVLDALDAEGLTNSTIIVFCADHGYHLGEHGLWGKTSCFELDARVPMIVCLPDGKNAGARSDALVELLDLYPTLGALCEVSTPADLQGTSLVGVLRDPSATVKQAAFSQHPRPAYFDRTEKGVPEAMGYSVRTSKVRYTEWRDFATGEIVGRELYDHVLDPREMVNAVDAPQLAEAQDEARSLLEKQMPRR